MVWTMNGKPRIKYHCVNHNDKRKTDDNPTGLSIGCGGSFLTCGNPKSCTLCGAELSEFEQNRRKAKYG